MTAPEENPVWRYHHLCRVAAELFAQADAIKARAEESPLRVAEYYRVLRAGRDAKREADALYFRLRAEQRTRLAERGDSRQMELVLPGLLRP